MNLKPRNARAGTLPNAKSVGILASQLSKYFAPASFLLAPGARASAAGGRNVAISTQTQNKPKSQDGTVLSMSVTPGVINWSFTENFTAPPAISAIPEGSGAATLYVDSVTTTGCVVKSTNGADTRLVHLTAIQT